MVDGYGQQEATSGVKMGSGALGIRMPVDEFMEGTRCTSWLSPPPWGQHAPVQMYMDQWTILEEVADVRALRCGDHIVAAIKVVRCVSPCVDRVTSKLSRYELTPLYHHFVVLDDADTLDKAGIPRTKEGKPVEILEYTNTVREAIAAVSNMVANSGGSASSVPGCTLRFLFDKATRHSVAIADYGDMPCLFRVVEALPQEERHRRTTEAQRQLESHERYNVFTNNCEHFINSICLERFSSPEVSIVRTNALLVAFRCVALAAVVCSTEEAIVSARPTRGVAWTLYELAVVSTIGLRAVMRSTSALRSVRTHYRADLISELQGWLLVATEFARSALVGVGATVTTILAPRALLGGPGTEIIIPRLSAAFAICASAYTGLDLLYGCIAQLSTRAVLRRCA